MLGLSRYQWLVLFAAWLGWGFDVFDGLLFNYVAPICVPNLLGLSPGDPTLSTQTTMWTAGLTCLLLLGWALGGILFGKVTDRLGRTRALLLTMLTYAGATALCSLAPNLWVLAGLRFIASLGIGGEWAAGASLVSEALPRERRVLGGALLYTSAPAGLFLATWVNDLFTRQLDSIASDPSLSWRLVFLTGLIPSAVAIAIRLKVKEPEGWKPSESPSVRELFSPALRHRTLGGLGMAVTALITWWSCSAFIPLVAAHLAREAVSSAMSAELAHTRAQYITLATTAFNVGGLLGTLLTVPIALRFGRRPMFLGYFLASIVAISGVFGLEMPHAQRLASIFFVGLTVFGVFGSFTFYLPELFPSRIRGTGSGFCYNAGRLVAMWGPFAVGYAARSGANPLEILKWVAIAPLVGVVLLLLGYAEETKDRDADALVA